MKSKEALRIILIFFIFLFLAWISLFDQTLQLKYKDITLLGLCIFCVLSFMYKGQFKFSKVDLALFVYLFIVTLTIPFSENKPAALYWYRLYILPIPLIYLAVRNLGEKFILPIALGIFVCSSIIALFGLFEIIFRRNIIYEFWVENQYYHRFIQDTPRIMSTLMHPTVFGSYLLGCLPFSFFLVSKMRNPYKMFVKLSIPICVLGIIFSFSRGNLAGLIGLSVVYLYLTNRRRYIKYIFIGLTVLILLSSTILLHDFQFLRLSLPEISSDWWKIHLEKSDITLKILKKYPLSGIGLNHYRLNFNEYSSEDYKRLEEKAKKRGRDPFEWKIADNMYLSILAETGLLGFSTFMLFLFLLFKKSSVLLKLIKDTKEKEFLIACICGIVGLLVSMNTYDLLYWINPFLLFWFLAGIHSSVID